MYKFEECKDIIKDELVADVLSMWAKLGIVSIEIISTPKPKSYDPEEDLSFEKDENVYYADGRKNPSDEYLVDEDVYDKETYALEEKYKERLPHWNQDFCEMAYAIACATLGCVKEEIGDRLHSIRMRHIEEGEPPYEEVYLDVKTRQITMRLSEKPFNEGYLTYVYDLTNGNACLFEYEGAA